MKSFTHLFTHLSFKAQLYAGNFSEGFVNFSTSADNSFGLLRTIHSVTFSSDVPKSSLYHLNSIDNETELSSLFITVLPSRKPSVAISSCSSSDSA